MALREFAKKKRGIYKPGQFQKLNATIPRLVDETINYLEENNCMVQILVLAHLSRR